jgi:Flp pilus assembly protein TadD
MLLGLSLMHLEDLPNACKALSKATDLDSSNPMIQLNFAAVLYKKGDMQAAAARLDAYEKTLRELGEAVDDDERQRFEELAKALMPKIHMGA